MNRNGTGEQGQIQDHCLIEALDSIGDPFYALDRQWRFTYVNAAAERLFQHQRHDVLGKSLWEQFPEWGKTDCYREYHRALEQNAPVQFETFDPQRQGWFEVRAYPFVEGLCIHCRDVTQRRRSTQMLRESEERFRKVFEEGPLGLALIGSDERYLRTNPAYCQMVGYNEEELRRLTWMDITQPDDVRTAQEAINGLLLGKISVYRAEKRYVRKDRQIRWGAITLSLVHSESDGKTYRLMTMVEDITERKRLDEDRAYLLKSEQAARAEAEVANRRKDQFMAVLSHELRTPLTPVMATLGLMRRESTLSAEDRRNLDVVEENIRLEAGLIDELLDISKLSQGTLQLALETVDVHEKLQSALKLCQAEIASKGLSIIFDLRAKAHHVRADPARLEEVFWNLIGNAVKYTTQGGSITVRSTDEADGMLRLQVIDTGIGIEPDVMKRLFTAFEQGEQTMTRRFGGLGLGLAISRALVSLHGGRIAAASEGKGKGATFTIDLPALIEPAAAGEPASPSANRQQGMRAVKILLVEDNPDTLRLLTRLLAAMGHEVRCAASVHGALEIAAAEPFDLLISDIGLPDGSGWELMRQLKGIRPIMAVALSGFGAEEDLRKSREAGFIAHLVKPIDVTKLEQFIEQADEARHVRAGLHE